jgi:hypothetical protein
MQRVDMDGPGDIEFPYACPYCGAKNIYLSVMEAVILARTYCEHCRGDVLIEYGKAKSPRL